MNFETLDNVLDYAILTEYGVVNCIDDDGNYYLDFSVDPKAGDALRANSYNGDTSTWHALGTGSYYMEVDDSIEGKDFYVGAIGTEHNFNSRYLYVSYIGENGENLGSSQSVNIEYAWSTNDYHLTYALNGTIPVGTKKIKFYGGGTGSQYVGVADIKIKNEPVINNIKHYPILTDNGVEQGYSTVTINYFKTSEQRQYKINDGEWENYSDEPIRLELDDILYAKGIDKDGNETRIISSYKSILPSDALNANAYNGDPSSWHALGTGSYYMEVDDSIEGKDFYVGAIGTQHNYSSRYLYVSYIGENGENLGSSQSVNIEYAWSTNDYHLTYALNGTIPVGTKKIKFYGGGTGSQYVGVADVKIKK